MRYKIKLTKLSKLFSDWRAVIANIGWLFFDRIFRMGVGLVFGVWIARHFGVKQYGLFNYAIAFVALLNPIANLGLDNVVIRDLVRDPLYKNQILGTTFWLKLLSGIGCLLVTLGLVYLLPNEENITILLVAILSVSGVFQAFDTIDLWFQSQVESKYTVIAKNAACLLVAILQITLLVMQAPLIAFAGAKSIEIGVGAVGLVIAYRFQGFSLSLWCWSSSLAKKLLKESLPLLLSGLTIMIYMRIDQIMLGQMLGNQAVGIYSAASRLSEAWYFIPTTIGSSIAPAIFAAKETSETLYYKRLRILLQLLVGISILVSIPMTFLSETIVILLYGREYLEAGRILAIHIWASLFVFLGVGTSYWFVAENLNHMALSRTFLGAITNVILNFVLIPRYGGVGAAIATVVAQANASFISHAFHPATRKLFRVQLRSLLPF